MHRVIEMSDVDYPHSHTDEGDDLKERQSGGGQYEVKQQYAAHECLGRLTLESCSPNSSSFCCRGVFSCSVAAIWSRIFPISVETPVAIAIPMAFPAAMLVP